MAKCCWLSTRFNREWCKEMVSDHDEAVGNFQDRMESTHDSVLKSWINETLRKLKMHLEMPEYAWSKSGIGSS